MGGGLALQLAAAHPGLAASLVLVDAYAGWAGSLPPAEVEARLAGAEAFAARPDAAVPPGAFSDRLTPDRARHLAAVVGDARPRGTLSMARAFAAADLRPLLGKVRVPTLVLTGALDERAPLPVAQALHAAIAGSRLVVVPDAGHELFLERPDEFRQALREFLTGV